MTHGDRVITTNHCCIKARMIGTIQGAGKTADTWDIQFDAPDHWHKGARWDVPECCSHPRHTNCVANGLRLLKENDPQGR